MGSSHTSIPDVIEAGRTAATLSDWQTITYFLIFLLVVSTVERILSGWQHRATAKMLSDAMDRMALATESRATDIKVTLALVQQQLANLRRTRS
jgi:hypothetical protein